MSNMLCPHCHKPINPAKLLKHRIKRPKNVSCVAKASRGVKRVSFAQMRVDVKPTNARKKNYKLQLRVSIVAI
ncbi:hypothetical protein [Helicobacter cinaedi]|uniref:hypothetical protein n=1 Tax=Helicobacter cinaedi TaxID=213 RepID=UPI0015F25FDD|nr:hypothetical protein [Helicobacter cinaedi]